MLDQSFFILLFLWAFHILIFPSRFKTYSTWTADLWFILQSNLIEKNEDCTTITHSLKHIIWMILEHSKSGFLSVMVFFYNAFFSVDSFKKLRYRFNFTSDDSACWANPFFLLTFLFSEEYTKAYVKTFSVEYFMKTAVLMYKTWSVLFGIFHENN